MQNLPLLPHLLDAGLSEKEAQLYMAGIELGEATIQELADQAGLKRPTAYVIMEGLKTKGLFSIGLRGKKRYYLAQDPETVLAQIKTRERAFVRALPELQMLFNTGDKKPRVRFYDGIEGLKGMYWEALESKETILVYGSIDDMWSLSKDFIKEYVKARVKKNIRIKGIVPATKDAQEYTKLGQKELRELVLVPADQFRFTNEINIYNNKVAIYSFKDRVGVIIESREIADTQRSIFNLAWLGAHHAV